MTVPLSTEQREELRRLAEAAKQSETDVPGVWHAVEEEASGYWSVNATGDGKTTAIHNHITYGPLEQTHRFIAAASPDVVLALLDALDAGPRSKEGLRHTDNPFERGRSRDVIAAEIAEMFGEHYPLLGLLTELESAVERDTRAALRATKEPSDDPT